MTSRINGLAQCLYGARATILCLQIGAVAQQRVNVFFGRQICADRMRIEVAIGALADTPGQVNIK